MNRGGSGVVLWLSAPTDLIRDLPLLLIISKALGRLLGLPEPHFPHL